MSAKPTLITIMQSSHVQRKGFVPCDFKAEYILTDGKQNLVLCLSGRRNLVTKEC